MTPRKTKLFVASGALLLALGLGGARAADAGKHATQVVYKKPVPKKAHAAAKRATKSRKDRSVLIVTKPPNDAPGFRLSGPHRRKRRPWSPNSRC